MAKSIESNLTYYVLLLAAHIGLVWLLPYFPTQDGPSHIYNLVILHDLLNGGKEWGSFFSHQVRAVPNLGFNIIAYPMLHFFSPLIVEKIFVSIYIILMGVSVPLFLRSFDRPSFPFAYFVFPVIFNFNLLMGFYSYAVAIPLFLFAFSYSWKIRDRSTACKFFCFNIAGLIIFYFHLIPFVFFLLSLIVITVVEPRGYKRKINNLLKILIIIAPSILNLFLYLVKGAKGSSTDFSYLLSLQRYINLSIDLITFSSLIFPWQILPAAIFTFFFILFVYPSIRGVFQSWLKNGEIPLSEKSLTFLASVLVLIYLFAPFSLGGGCYFNQRFPWVILLTTLPLMRIPETIFSRRFFSIVIPSAATVFFVFNAAILWQQSTKVEKFLSGLPAEGLSKGAFVMTYKSNLPEWSRIDVLMHAASYYGIFRGCVNIGNYETDFDYFPIHFRNNLPAMPSPRQVVYLPGTIHWDDYASIQYLLGWEISSNERAELGEFFHIIWEDGPFSIWQRTIRCKD